MAQNPPDYFEQTYQAPWRGVNSNLPENKIGQEFTPFAQNWIVRAGELRTRPRSYRVLPGLPQGGQATAITSFMDSNNVIHTVAINNFGLFQLNSAWRKNPSQVWSLVSQFTGALPAPSNPAQVQVFLDKLYFANGSANLWQWDGITPNSKATLPGLTSIAVYDIANGLTAGGFFLGELDSRLILLNTVEQLNAAGKPTSSFPQRIRWSASGIPNAWDASVNIGAGFNDELDVPDTITGFLAIGRNGFIFRVNGISEMISISAGVLPFDFNHLWAQERGIGNIYPFSIAGYGPIGMFISSDDIYELSLGGFKKVGGVARNVIFTDLANAVAAPVASMFPSYKDGYPYLTYLLSIPLSGNICKNWTYFVDDEAWFPWTSSNGYLTGRIRLVASI